jgi:DNA-binding IclR family transcriptional regulator
MRRAPRRTPNMSSADKVLSVLSLFTAEHSVWSAEDAAAELKVSLSTAYRYFNSLVSCGLLDRIYRNHYVLGPAIIEHDWQIRMADPVLSVAKPIMLDLLRSSDGAATVLLCRLYRQRVMCIHQETNRLDDPVSSYERGRPRPMLRGATSKIILAFLPTRTLANLWRDHRDEIAATGLGSTFEDFKATLKVLRRNGFCVSRGEVDPGRIGIAAPIFDAHDRIVGSLSIVLYSAETSDRSINRLAALVVAAARDIVWTGRGMQPAAGDHATIPATGQRQAL